MPPLEHKYAAIRYMLNRLHKYRMNDEEKRTEQQIIEQINIKKLLKKIQLDHQTHHHLVPPVKEQIQCHYNYHL
jgi:hypothetical protein